MVNLSPIFSMLWATLWLNEDVPSRAWPGVALSFAGVVLLAVGESHHGESFQFNVYTLLLLITALSASFYTVLQKRLVSRCHPMGLISGSVWFGTLFLLVFSPGFADAVRNAPPAALAVIFYLGVFPAALSYAIWTWALSRLPVATVVSFMYLVAPLATLIAWVWLGEVPAPLALFGGVLALSGVIWVNAAKRKAA
jgi:drug/metabolite transporter (DMT)-like permease